MLDSGLSVRIYERIPRLLTQYLNLLPCLSTDSIIWNIYSLHHYVLFYHHLTQLFRPLPPIIKLLDLPLTDLIVNIHFKTLRLSLDAELILHAFLLSLIRFYCFDLVIERQPKCRQVYLWHLFFVNFEEVLLVEIE